MLFLWLDFRKKGGVMNQQERECFDALLQKCKKVQIEGVVRLELW